MVCEAENGGANTINDILMVAPSLDQTDESQDPSRFPRVTDDERSVFLKRERGADRW